MLCYGDIDVQDQGDKVYWGKLEKASYAQVAFSEGEPVGYIDFLKISDSGVRGFYEGTIRDGSLENVVDLSDSKEVFLYLTSICFLPKYRGKGLARLLWNASRENCIKEGLKVKDIFAITWTQEGERFLDRFNPLKISTDTHGHPIVVISSIDGDLPFLSGKDV